MAVRRRVLDAAPTIALIAIGAAQLLADYGGSGFRGPRGANAAFLIAVCLPLLVRRRRPVLALAGVFLVQAVWVGAYYHGSHQPPFEPFAAGVVACFALGLHADRRGLRAGLVVFALLVVASAIVLAAGGSAVGNALPVLIWWGAAIGIGRGLRERQGLVELLRERSARLERDRERDMADAALEERARIARELHDVIAHAVSLMVVQASAERRLLPQRARHEHVGRVRPVVAERRAAHEAVTRIERACRREERRRGRGEAEAGHPARPRRLDDVLHHRGAVPTPAHVLGHVHRPHLAMVVRQRVEGDDADERRPRVVLPRGPEGQAWRTHQRREVQGVTAFASRLRERARDVDVEELDDAWVVETPFSDVHDTVTR